MKSRECERARIEIAVSREMTTRRKAHIDKSREVNHWPEGFTASIRIASNQLRLITTVRCLNKSLMRVRASNILA